MTTSLPINSKNKSSAILESKLENLKISKQEDVIHKQAQALGISYIDLHNIYIKPTDIQVIPKEVAQKLGIVSYSKGSEIIKLGIVNYREPEIKNITSDLKQKYSVKVTMDLISEDSFKKALKVYDKILEKEESKDIKISETEIEKFTKMVGGLLGIKKYIHRLNITEILNLVLSASLKSLASDIHIEPQEQESEIRFRIDGVLHNIAKISKETGDNILKRIKLISGLKMNITNKPQDGRFSVIYLNNKIDVRVSTLPSSYGESTVMRLLGETEYYFSLENLGIRKYFLSILEAEIKKPNGMILSCGPTGSGKTTTLYAVLNKLNIPETKIITLEDPIEYKLSGITQTQVKQEKGYSFAGGLRSILRQDPDIIMVGEIRDLETADTAVNAALTGHLVLSTVHTNSAVGAIPRLLSMGVKPFLLAPALNVIIGQRLVRLLCQKCKTQAELDSQILSKVKEILDKLPTIEHEKIDFKNLKFWQSQGCSNCNGLGFKGRIGIFEILPIIEILEEIILKAELSEYKIKEQAQKQGMITMVQDGILKALDGQTSIEEVFRVAQ